MLNAPLNASPRPLWSLILATVAIVFGGLTLWSGGQVLFGPEAIRAEVGQILPVIVWFNFVSGFFYVLAGIELMRWRESSVVLAALLATSLVLVWVYFALHIIVGGAYEFRTLLAMVLRLAFWLATALLTYRAFKNLNITSSSNIR